MLISYALVVASVASFALVKTIQYRSAHAAGWVFTSVQGDNVTASNNPGGGVTNGLSESPQNGTLFSPAFGKENSTVTINGSGFPDPNNLLSVDARKAQFSKGTGCYLGNDDWLYCWGGNNYGQLADGTTTTSQFIRPIQRGEILEEESIADFSMADGFMCIRTNLGRAYCWGYNSSGTLGVGNTNSGYITPVRVANGDMSQGETFKSITAGTRNTCAISSLDVLYCWGYNSDGQLGDGTTSSAYVPRKVKTYSDNTALYTMPDTVSDVSIGNFSVCAVAGEGSVYCWGQNSSGQLGNNTTQNKSLPVKIYNMDSYKFIQVEAGLSNACALDDNGNAYCWGSNSSGQLGNGTTISSSVPIAVSGNLHFKSLGETVSVWTKCAITLENVPYCWGAGGDSMFGPGAGDTTVPVKIKTQSDGEQYEMPDAVTSISSSDPTDSNGTWSGNSAWIACASGVDAKVYCWGRSGLQFKGAASFGMNINPANNNAVSFDYPTSIRRVDGGDLWVGFDDIYSQKCQSVTIISTTQLKCQVVGMPEGLHDVLASYGGQIQTLPQSYMYRIIPDLPTNLAGIGLNKMVRLNFDWSADKPYFTSASFSVECKISSNSVWYDSVTSGCSGGGITSSGSVTSTNNMNGTATIVGLQNDVSYDFRIGSSSYGWTYANNIVPQSSSYVPSAPVITSLQSDANSIQLTWSTPQSDGGSPIIGYMPMLRCASATSAPLVQRTIYINSTGNNVSSWSMASSCRSATQPAYFSVIAINANGASEPSEVATVQLNQPPGIPSNIKVNNINTTQTMLSWSAPSNNGSPITSYEMRYSTSSVFSDWVDNTNNTCISNTPSPPTTSCVSPSLALGTLYYFQVRAVNANGTSGWSIIHATVVGAPDRPVINTVTASNGQVYVAWSPPNNNGAAITNYVLEYATNPDFTGATQLSTGVNTNYTLNPATNGTIYYFRVLATNSRGDSPWSDPVSGIPYAPPNILSISPDHGLTVGGELTTISGDNLNGTTSVTIGGNNCQTFVVVDVHTINCLTPAGTFGPQDVVVTNMGGSDTLDDGYTYSEPSLEISGLGNITLNVNASSGTVSNSHTAVVKTDHPYGYNMTLSMQTTNQNLQGQGSIIGQAIGPTNATATPSPLPDNNWGFSLQDANNHWVCVPSSLYPKNIKTRATATPNGMAGAGEATTVYYGAKVNFDQSIGSYKATVVYRATVGI